jgi:spoIIIJ-associated protein
MPPNERRIIHIELRNDPSVQTESEGVGDKRKVTIRPVAAD